jgi:hypothetical protein
VLTSASPPVCPAPSVHGPVLHYDSDSDSGLQPPRLQAFVLSSQTPPGWTPSFPPRPLTPFSRGTTPPSPPTPRPPPAGREGPPWPGLQVATTSAGSVPASGL